jgi:PAS domain S-box-containing protein
MKNKTNNLSETEILRQKAEEKLKKQRMKANLALSEAELLKLIHELQVHQIELEMQNEELQIAKEKAEIAEEKYIELFDFAPTGYLSLSKEGTITELNFALANMLGIDRLNLIGKRFLLFVSEETRSAFNTFFEQVFESGEKQNCDLNVIGRGKMHIDIAIHGIVNQKKDNCFLTIVDISKRKQAEEARELLQEQLVQVQKMESVGRLAGGVAHDFNNKLMVIMGHAELAMSKISHEDKLYKDLMEIYQAAEHSADLTRQLLAFARRQVIQPKVLNMNDLVSDMLEMLRKLLGANIELTWDPGADIWPVRVDPTQIDQILANLTVNAREAIAQTGYFNIRTANISVDDIFCYKHSDRKPGDYVQLIVSDTGCGMSNEQIEHLFEPFFTTRPIVEGRGLGLSIVYGIVQQNKGFITVYSNPGYGTTFTIYIPRYVKDVKAAEPITKSTKLIGGNETILLVDDEAAILNLHQRLLHSLGYEVIKAISPAEALEKALELDGKIDLLLTDVIMPGMNGRQLAEQLQTRYPHLKVIYVSGYTADIISYQGIWERDVHFLQKPFTKAALANKIREAISFTSVLPS